MITIFFDSFLANSSSSSSSSSASSLQSTSHRREPQDKLTEELLNEFIELDREIQKLEAEHTEEKLTLHQLEYTNLETALKEKQKELGELKEKMYVLFFSDISVIFFFILKICCTIFLFLIIIFSV